MNKTTTVFFPLDIEAFFEEAIKANQDFNKGQFIVDSVRDSIDKVGAQSFLCDHCGNYLPKVCFNKDSSKQSRKSSFCKNCTAINEAQSKPPKE